MSFSTIFTSKSKQVKTDAEIRIHDVSGIPLVSGMYFIRWKLKGGSEGATEA
jgi:hypothetical protein